MSSSAPAGALPKCVVWDLDNTLWHGIAIEGDALAVNLCAHRAILQLDDRGVINSVASRSEAELGLETLQRLQLRDYFVAPQINWGPKSESIRRISDALGFALDTIVFVDDEPFERAEVHAALPAVRCYSAEDIPRLVEVLSLERIEVTAESRMRRELYRAEEGRKHAEEIFSGPSEEFLRALDLVLRIAVPGVADLDRAEELTRRTSQLNSTGRVYSEPELSQLLGSADHRLVMATLEDRFGTYGRIGLAVVEVHAQYWRLKLLLTSCRVLSRGIGSVLLAHLMHRAAEAGVRFLADFVHTERNRIMFVMYRFAGLRQLGDDRGGLLLEADLSTRSPVPAHVRIHDDVVWT